MFISKISQQKCSQLKTQGNNPPSVLVSTDWNPQNSTQVTRMSVMHKQRRPDKQTTRRCKSWKPQGQISKILGGWGQQAGISHIVLLSQGWKQWTVSRQGCDFNYAGVMLDKPIKELNRYNKSTRLTVTNSTNSCTARMWWKDDFGQDFVQWLFPAPGEA